MHQTAAQNPKSTGGLAQSQVFFLMARDDRLFLVILVGWGKGAAEISQSRENPKRTAGSPKDAQETLFSGMCAEASVTSALRKTSCL